MTEGEDVNAANWTVSIDAGGTFTDAIARSANGEVAVAKVASTPHDPSQGLSNAILALAVEGLPLDQVSLLCHGTTVATNAILTDELAPVALVATEGFRDVMGYRQSSRPDVYSLTPERPKELVPRRARVEVRERIDSRGQVLTELTDAEIDRVVAEVVAAAPSAVAVSLLFSYLNDEHERRIGEALTRALPGTPVSLSSDVAREFREYPRTATTVINAALRPVVGSYLERAEAAVGEAGLRAPFLVMQSNGGSVPATRAEPQSHQLVLSGPAGGVAGLLDLAAVHGISNLISLDMGGTSTDVCLVREGRAPFAREQHVHGHTLLAPTVDIHTIGAGGGSIGWVDQTDRLRVGPQSARALPGPASYGRGGTEPTITDAHVVLGTLGGGDLAGGLTLDREAAIESMRAVGERLALTPEEAAEAILAIGLAHMVQAVRKVSIERGLDPKEFSLVPFGGAGPLHAGLLLQHLGLRSVIVPRQPGLFSADGLLVAGVRFDDSRTVLKTFDPSAIAEIAQWYASAAESGRQRLIADGVAAADIAVLASVDCRYRGQGYELTIPLPGHGEDGLLRAAELFHDAHAELYGHANRGEDVELVTVRIAVTGALARPASGADVPQEQNDAALIARRTVLIPGAGSTEVDVYDRALLAAGDVFTGPAIVQQMDSTTFVLAGQTVTVAAQGDLIITQEDQA
ncbi:hydantoinase/oxoprolinase family protein [Microbacterium sp. YJN-G]|uniref:hydantoinase/oxoprolinase family protein n=1 Tax=Microbacterium sp. YJN-G TaxID=2763257 RepID=UPI001D0C7885|nr:hydantoinase/oxoprolinase family protein [Microbacterium sp. YJN-G]